MTGMLLIMCGLVLFEGALLAGTPWLMPPTECFAVTVPPSARRDPRVRGYLRRYALTVGVVSVACALALALFLGALVSQGLPSSDQSVRAGLAVSCATLVPIAAGMALMLRYRSLVRALKRAEGWEATERRTAALVGDEAPRPISLAWNLLYVPLVLGMAVCALLIYDRLPARIPMSTDLTGAVVAYAPKSVGAALFPVYVAAFMGIVLTLTHAAIIVSKRPVDPEAPATSSYAYGRFARLLSMALLVGGLALSAVTGATFYLTALGVISLGTAGAVTGGVTLLFALGVAALAVVHGQAGGRMAAELRTSDDVARDDDRFWPLGVFYCNADDPSVVVPKRFGVGWTFNVARPASWALFVGMMALTAAFVLLVGRLVG